MQKTFCKYRLFVDMADFYSKHKKTAANLIQSGTTLVKTLCRRRGICFYRMMFRPSSFAAACFAGNEEVIVSA